MSRIGNKPIPVPRDVKIDMHGSSIKVTGPKGTLERSLLPVIELERQDDVLVVTGRDSSKRTNAFRGMTRSLIDNMVTGVTRGFSRKLIVEGVGYRVSVAGKTLTLNVGYSNPVEYPLPEGVSAAVDRNEITLEYIDKELLGQTAAKIRAIRKPEPYKGKGIRYADEHIVRKVGKTAGKK